MSVVASTKFCAQKITVDDTVESLRIVGRNTAWQRYNLGTDIGIEEKRAGIPLLSRTVNHTMRRREQQPVTPAMQHIANIHYE